MTLPIEKANEVTNGFTFFCDDRKQQCFYRACLHLVSAVEAGRLIPAEEKKGDCASAMLHKTCTAHKMRQEELEKGETIYFKERGGTLERPDAVKLSARNTIDENDPGYVRGWNMLDRAEGAPLSRQPVARQPRANQVAPITPDSAAVVNDMVKGKAERVYTKVELTAIANRVKQLHEAGETDRARALLAQLKLIIARQQPKEEK